MCSRHLHEYTPRSSRGSSSASAPSCTDADRQPADQACTYFDQITRRTRRSTRVRLVPEEENGTGPRCSSPPSSRAPTTIPPRRRTGCGRRRPVRAAPPDRAAATAQGSRRRCSSPRVPHRAEWRAHCDVGRRPDVGVLVLCMRTRSRCAPRARTRGRRPPPPPPPLPLTPEHARAQFMQFFYYYFLTSSSCTSRTCGGSRRASLRLHMFRMHGPKVVFCPVYWESAKDITQNNCWRFRS